MAWTAPMTAVALDLLTATEYNKYVRDNFLETAPSIASTSGGIFTVDVANRLQQRFMGTKVVNEEHRISICDVTYKDVQSAGPFVTVKTGGVATVIISAEMMNSNTNAQASASFEISGATTRAASDNWRITHDGVTGGKWSRQTSAHRVSDLTAGLNTFRMKYRTGNLGPVHFRRREITVIPF